MITDNTKLPTNKTMNWFKKPTNEHIVQFYSSNSNLLPPLHEFIYTGIRRNESCLVIATPAHVLAISNLLQAQGIDVATAQINNQLVMLDASETLAKFMVNGMPSKNRFFDVIGSLVQFHSQKGKPIRAFGEMVALLWRVGNKDAVIELEKLWNELASRHSFSLFCAYPELHFIMDYGAKQEIAHTHSFQA